MEKVVTLVLIDGDGKTMKTFLFSILGSEEMAEFVEFKFFRKDGIKFKGRLPNYLKFRTVAKRNKSHVHNLVSYLIDKMNGMSDTVYYLQNKEILFYGTLGGLAVYNYRSVLFTVTEKHFEIIWSDAELRKFNKGGKNDISKD